MAIVKTLDIILRASTGKLTSDVKKASRELKKLFDIAGPLTAGITSAVSLGAAISTLRNEFNRIDEIGDAAAVFGVAFDEMNRLTIAANLSGQSVDDFSTLAGKLSLKAYEASVGNKELAEAFRVLNIDSKAFLGLSLESKIKAVADAFSSVDLTQMDKMRVASELFGKSWTKILPVLNESAAALQRAAKWSAMYKLGLSESQVSLVENANWAFGELMASIQGVARHVAVQLAPTLELLMRQMAEAIRPGTALNGVLRGMGDLLQVVATIAALVATSINMLSTLFGGWGGHLARTIVLLGGLVVVMRTMITTMRLLYSITKAQVLIETVLGAIRGLSFKQAAAVGAAIATITLALGALEAQAGNAWAELGKIGDVAMDMKSMGDINVKASVNPQSAQFGSQAAFEQLYKVNVAGPIDDMIKKQEEANIILGEIRDGVHGDDPTGFATKGIF